MRLESFSIDIAYLVVKTVAIPTGDMECFRGNCVFIGSPCMC